MTNSEEKVSESGDDNTKSTNHSENDGVVEKADEVNGEENVDAVVEEVDAEEKAAAEQRKKDDETKPVFYIGLFVLGMSLLGLLDLTVLLGPNQCQMTYMYEWPEYINIRQGFHIPLRLRWILRYSYYIGVNIWAMHQQYIYIQ